MESNDEDKSLDMSPYLRPQFLPGQHPAESDFDFAVLPPISLYEGPGDRLDGGTSLRTVFSMVRDMNICLDVVDKLVGGASIVIHDGVPVALSYFCKGCKHEIDIGCCWCGNDYQSHSMGEHSFVPMGCNCFRPKPKEKGADGT